MTSVELFFEDSEDEINENIENIARIRKNIRDKSNPLELYDETFIKNFRLSKCAFTYLLEDIDEKLKIPVRQRAVPSIIKLAAVLRFCASGSYQLSIGNDFNLGLAQPTISLVFKEVLNILESHVCSKWIKFNYTQNEKRQVKIYFYEKSRIPNVIGSVDGTHIGIVGPKPELRHLYYCRRGFYSINAMIVCDHMMRIRYIDAKNPGASHDSHIWNTSNLKRKIEEEYQNGNNDFRLLGDGGYPIAPYLMTPYRNAEEGSSQGRFNKRHLQGRNIVERTIGIWKSRFRCILSARELKYKPETATKIANVCAALHNICIYYSVPVLNNEENEVNEEDEVDNFIETENNNNNNLINGNRIRDAIAIPM